MTRGTLGWLLVATQVLLFVVLALLPWRAPAVLGLVLGAALVIGGIVLALAAARGLGSALTATPVPISGAGLRTSGAYGFVRHPIYSALLLATLGLLLAMGSIWSWIWGAVILVFFWTKSRWEDRLLHEEYGAAWATWARTTGALVPRPSRLARRS